MANRKRTKGQTTILKTLHSKVKIEQHEPHTNPGVNACSPEGTIFPAPHVTPMPKMVGNMMSQESCR